MDLGFTGLCLLFRNQLHFENYINVFKHDRAIKPVTATISIKVYSFRLFLKIFKKGRKKGKRKKKKRR